jgi:GT2 family glycosyltransferase
LSAEIARKYHFVEVIENKTNVGFGGAINQVLLKRPAKYLGVLNDDAVMRPRCLEALMHEFDVNPRIGMTAPRILRAGTDIIDSAGMALARDGSSAQRGHGEPACAWAESGEVLFPSGCAAIYRGAMLMETGVFDETLFLYHEDTDLGLRAQWMGWRCIYVPGAEVEHECSATVGRASEIKAWYVERNRLRTVWKLFPPRDVAIAHFFALGRYAYHLVAALTGRGLTAQFKHSGQSLCKLPYLVFKAHLNLVSEMRGVMRKRGQTPRRLTPSQFRAILARHRIRIREVAFH